MPKKEKRALGGAVAFNADAMMFIAKATTGNEESTNSNKQCAKFDERNRWAYLIVSYEESLKFRKHNENEKILKVIQDKYAPLLESAIEENCASVRADIKDMKLRKEGKLIHLVQANACASTSLEKLLLGYDMHAHAQDLDAIHKEEGAMITRILLPFLTRDCHKYLEEEKGSSNRPNHAYAVVALAYGYRGKDAELKQISAKNAIVSLLPKTRLECGIFFDGTNNNKFNIQMRKDYETFLNEKNKIFDQGSYTLGSWEKGIIDKLPKSQVLPLIFKDLKNSITSYGYNTSSQDEYNGGWLFGLWQDKISSDTEAIYEYFQDENRVEASEFVENQLLPLDFIDKITGETESSYTGAKTNVVKLFEHYETQITKSDDKQKHLFKPYRKKLYVTGAGTYDSRQTGEAKDDEVFLGSALAMYGTGVTTKVEEACKDLGEVLKSLDTKYIDCLVLDVFGFSRGAAEARHFVGSITKELPDVLERKFVDNKGAEYTEYELSHNAQNLYPYIVKEKEGEKDAIIINKIVFRFIGIFDTVPHYGLSQDNDVHELNLTLPAKKVSKVVHLTALQEYRHNFDLVSIFSNENKKDGVQIKDDFEEKQFFGAHSDVGGGYNDGHEEFIMLPSQYFYHDDKTNDGKVKKLVQKWNNTYLWVDNKNIQVIKDKDDIDKTRDGLYIIKRLRRHRNHHTVVRTSARYDIYMYRTEVEAEYSEMPLEYMHNKAKTLLPMKKLSSIKYRDIAILKDNKENLLKLKEDTLNEIRSDFIHHSSTAGIAHCPNEGKEHILYGQRIIHYV